MGDRWMVVLASGGRFGKSKACDPKQGLLDRLPRILKVDPVVLKPPFASKKVDESHILSLESLGRCSYPRPRHCLNGLK